MHLINWQIVFLETITQIPSASFMATVAELNDFIMLPTEAPPDILGPMKSTTSINPHYQSTAPLSAVDWTIVYKKSSRLCKSQCSKMH